MKIRSFCIALLFLIPVICYSQGMEQGDITISSGIEIGIYGNDVTASIFGQDTTVQDTAAAWFVPIVLEYCIHDMFSAGLIVKPGEYFDDDVNQRNKARVFAATVSFHPLDHKVLDPYIRMSAGYSSLNITDDDEFFQEGKWSGIHYEVDAAFRFLIGDHFAVQMFGGYNLYNLKLREWTVNGDVVSDNPDSDLRWDMRVSGAEIGFGIVGRF